MKERIQKLVKECAELHRELDWQVQNAACLHMTKQIELCIATGHHHGYGLPSDPKQNYEWNLDKEAETGIELRWDEYWRYGGHDGGTFYLSWDFILNEQEQQEYVAKIDQEIAEGKQKIAERDRAEKQRQFDRLKAELEGETK